MIILSFLIFIYVCIYPPIIWNIFVEPFDRLVLETLVLFIIILYAQLRDTLKVPKDLVWLIALVALYWLFSSDESRQVLSFFNKYVFFIFLLGVIHHCRELFVWLRKLWVILWLLMSISAVLACFGFITGTLHFVPFRFAGYEYQGNPFLGLILPKGFGALILARYSGWFAEPSLLAFFFGVNAFMAKHLFNNVTRMRVFKWLNTFAGLLTFSTTFYVFFFGYYLYQIVRRKMLLPKTIIYIMCIPALLLLIHIWKNPDLISFTSVIDRIWRFEGAWKALTNLNIVHVLFGYGIIPLQTTLGGGTSSGLLDIILGRGLLLFVFVMVLVIRYTKHIPALVLFIICFNLSFNFLSYPLFLLAVVLGYEAYARKSALMTAPAGGTG